MVGIIEDLVFSSAEEGHEVIDRIYFDGFIGQSSQTDQYVLDSGETLLTQVFASDTDGERYAEAYSLLLSRSDSNYDYEDAIFVS